MTYISNKGIVDANNSTSVALNAGATFTGTATNVTQFPSIVVAVKTDQQGIIYVDFSSDGTNWDSTLTSSVSASTSDVHRYTVIRKFFRIRFTNSSASNQTYLRLQVILGQGQSLTSQLNTPIQSDADTLVVRPLDFNLMVAEGLYENTTNTIKDGINFDIDTTSVPEDLWDNGSTYTGFPVGTIQEGQVVVAGADTGTVYYAYLESETSTDYAFASVAIAGAGNYNLGHDIWRCNFMYFVSSSATAFNVGLISLRHRTTTANVFCSITAGYSQSFCSAYTVPYNNSIYIDRITFNMRGSTSGSIDGGFWYRPYGESPRIRFPFEANFGSMYFDDIDYLIKIPSRTDVMPRVLFASANNLTAKVSYRIIKVKE